jgi:membrane protein YqaA with SNARE-associated domain
MLVFFITIWSWLERLGGIGLILLGFVDNSPVPLPGSMDALTIILSASQKDWWPYYATMATIGGLVGGYATYALAREGGKEGLEKKLSKQRAERVYKVFNQYGFWSLIVPGLLPPPVPFSPFLIAAGALNYSRHKFLIAVGAARGIRYGALGYLASRYGGQLFSFFQEYYRPILWAFLAVTVSGLVAAAAYVWKRKKDGKSVLSKSKDLEAA